MDKLIFDNASKGMEGSWENLNTLQRSFLEGFASVLKALIPNYNSSKIYILNGCDISNLPQWSITYGYVFYNGEIFKVQATSFDISSGSVGVFDIKTTSITTPFRDLIEYEVEQTRVIEFKLDLSGSGIGDYNQTETLIDNMSQYVESVIVSGAPGALDTLNELAEALGDDENFATTITNLIGTKSDKAPGTWLNIETPVTTSAETVDVSNAFVRLSDQGQIQFKGFIIYTMNSYLLISNLGKIPDSLIANRLVRINASIAQGFYLENKPAIISTDGRLQTYPSNDILTNGIGTTYVYSFDNASYWLN